MREQKRKRLEKYKFSVNHMYKLCIVNVNVLLIHVYEYRGYFSCYICYSLNQQVSSVLPEPNWELSIAFKQLLRTNHQFVATARAPRPSNASNNESPQLRSAGSSALSTSDMKQFEPE